MANDRSGMQSITQALAGGMQEVSGNCPDHGDWRVTLPPSAAADARCPSCQEAERSAEERRREAEEKARHRAKKLAYLEEHCRVPPRYQGRGFEHYKVIGDQQDKQEKVLRACRGYAARFPEARRRGASLVLCGGVGVGKTHLGCAIIQQVIHQHLVDAQFWRVFEVVAHIRAAYGARDTSLLQAVQAMVKPTLLVIDDVGAQHGSKDEGVLLNELISQRHDALHPTIILSNEDRDGLATYLGTRVLDRLEEDGGTILACPWKSYRKQVINDDDLPRPK